METQVHSANTGETIHYCNINSLKTEPEINLLHILLFSLLDAKHIIKLVIARFRQYINILWISRLLELETKTRAGDIFLRTFIEFSEIVNTLPLIH